MSQASSAKSRTSCLSPTTKFNRQANAKIDMSHILSKLDGSGAENPPKKKVRTKQVFLESHSIKTFAQVDEAK